MKCCLRTNAISVVSCWANNTKGSKLYSTTPPSKFFQTNVENSFLWNLSGNLFKRGSFSFLFDGLLCSYNWSKKI